MHQLHAAGAIIPSDYAMINSFADSHEAVPYVEAEMNAPIAGTDESHIQLLRFERINNPRSDNEP